MMLEIAGAVALLALGFVGGSIAMAVDRRECARNLRLAASGVEKWPARSIQMLNAMADALEGK